MRTLLHLVALVAGAAIMVRGLSQGLPGYPFNANQWGTVAAFGFGVLMALVGVRHLWLRSTGDDAAISGGTSLLLVVAAAAVTAGAVAWRGGTGSTARECAQVLDHVQGLFAAREGAEAAQARFDVLRPNLLQRCVEMPSARRRCPQQATTLEEFQSCP